MVYTPKRTQILLRTGRLSQKAKFQMVIEYDYFTVFFANLYLLVLKNSKYYDSVVDLGGIINKKPKTCCGRAVPKNAKKIVPSATAIFWILPPPLFQIFSAYEEGPVLLYLKIFHSLHKSISTLR